MQTPIDFAWLSRVSTSVVCEKYRLRHIWPGRTKKPSNEKNGCLHQPMSLPLIRVTVFCSASKARASKSVV